MEPRSVGAPKKAGEIKQQYGVSMTISERKMAVRGAGKRDLSTSAYIVELVKEDCEDEQ